MAHKKQLGRLLRVRTLQLNLVRADEARAADKRARERLGELAARESALAAERRRARLAVRADQVDVELDGPNHFGAGELSVPVLVEPAAAEGVDHGVERGQRFTPARLAA